MTERDAFEVRFEAAVRGYIGRVSSDVDPAELAHRIAVAEPRRHGLATVLTGRLVANPLRTVWVLLLVAALLALVAGTLAVGSRLLESREPLPERLPALLEGMVAEEVEPGVFRVINDGIRDLSSTDAVDVVAGYDGGIWLLREQGFLRLGSNRVHEWPTGSVPGTHVGPESHVLQVAPDGTLWVIPTRTVFSTVTGSWVWPGEVFRSTDGETWSSQPCPGDHCRGVTVAPDGTLWASWYDGSACGSGDEESCEWWVGYLSPTGWQPLDGSTPGDLVFGRLAFTDAGDLYGIGCSWDCLLYRYEDGAWRQEVFAALVDVGPDGSVWLYGGFFFGPDEQSFGRDLVTRFADGELEGWTSADLPEIKSGVGIDGQFKVALDGSLWFSMSRNDPGTATGSASGDVSVRPNTGDTWCDGLDRFDGKTLDRFLPGQCISMDIAADGSVWVVAGNDDVLHSDGVVDLYVITPEAVAATE